MTLNKVNASRIDFDSNYQYYLDRPAMFEKVFEKVITNLSSRSAELEEKRKKELFKQKDTVKVIRTDSTAAIQ